MAKSTKKVSAWIPLRERPAPLQSAAKAVAPNSLRFIPTSLAGAYLVQVLPYKDQRGIFSRVCCADAFAAEGLESSFVQTSVSTSVIAGTLRGMHFQREPRAEVKLVRCIKGAIYDVIIDLRKDSDTYLRWFGAELSEANGLAMYAPKGFAHGCQTLTNGATVLYMMSAFYAPQYESGVRYSDPTFSIGWPRAVSDISEKDAQWPLLPP